MKLILSYVSSHQLHHFHHIDIRIYFSWTEFQTMIIPQPVGGIGVSSGGQWGTKPHSSKPISVHPCTLSVSNLTRVTPAPEVGVAVGGPLQTWEKMSVGHP